MCSERMRNFCSCNIVCYFLALGIVCITLILAVIFEENHLQNRNPFPLAINTWPFTNATAAAWDVLYNRNLSALDAVEVGCSVCEQEQCDFTVGYGGSPDENGETTLDAFIMDGSTMNVGAVGALRGVKSAISVARRVMENTRHSILVGELATQFASNMGFQTESLETNQSKLMWQNWVKADCQPNYWMNVSPDPTKQCGPYRPINHQVKEVQEPQQGHDTITMLAIDREGRIAAGSSSNGANHKIPGRVGDAPLVGAGAYADGTVGAAGCTGDGDVMMRFLPSFLAVEEMRRGAAPNSATNTAISRIIQYYPKFSGAIIAVNLLGEYAAACHGMDSFPFSIHTVDHPQGMVVRVPCL